MWYCVHAIFHFELQEDHQESWLVHENVYLIRAEDSSNATKFGEERARIHEDLSKDGHLLQNGRKCSYQFAGIRKVISVEPHDKGKNLPSLVEVELTYSVFEVDTKEEVQALVDGKMVSLLYRE